MPGQYTDNSQWNDPVFQDKMQAMYRERDEPTRQKMIREMTGDILDKAPYIWLPVADTYAAWWPWVKKLRRRNLWWRVLVAAGPFAFSGIQSSNFV